MFNLVRGVLNTLIFFFSMSAFGFAQTNEQITLTTYYPSPQGSYLELRAKRLALGDGYVSPASYCWAPAACGNIIDADADLVVDGDVGIGTITPKNKLTVRGGVWPPSPAISKQLATFGADISLSNTHAAQLEVQTTGAIGTLARLVFSHLGDTSASIQSAGDAAISGWLSFSSREAGGELVERMRIDKDGNVGIGTATPSSQSLLHLKRQNEIDVWLEGGSPDIKFITNPPNYDSWRIGMDEGNGNFRITTNQRNTGNPDIIVLSDIFEFTQNGYLGLGTNSPGSDRLDVRGRAYAEGGWQTVDADYAEWLEKEGDPVAGDIIGIDLATGKARKYQPGDKLVGVCSLNPGVVGNRMKETEEEMRKTHVLVGLLGQLDFGKDQVVVENRIVKTKDGKEIGVLLSNGKVLVGR